MVSIDTDLKNYIFEEKFKENPFSDSVFLQPPSCSWFTLPCEVVCVLDPRTPSRVVFSSFGNQGSSHEHVLRTRTEVLNTLIISAVHIDFIYSYNDYKKCLPIFKPCHITSSCCNKIQCTILLPQLVFDAIIDTGGSLITPQQRLIYNMGECAVKELKQLVPFHGVILACIEITDSDSIMHDMLQRNFNSSVIKSLNSGKEIKGKY
jgi:hypothetical protein